MKHQLQPMFERNVHANNEFIQSVMSTFNKTQIEAEKVLRVFKKAKAVKLNNLVYDLTHGMYWDIDVINNAINL